ncbi:MAG: protein phosphatase 2C domain-containing protein [Bacteroidota bacterium]
MNLSSIYYLHEIGGKKNQEDYIWPTAGTALPAHKIFIVCDGVGGAEHGEIASRLIAEYTGNKLLQTPVGEISTGFINTLLENARQNLVAHARAEGLNNEMATTFSLLLLFADKAFIAWCGDTRVYHIRDGVIQYKTADHSLVNTLVKNGEITEQEAHHHPQKHIILKAITGDDSPIEAEGHWITEIAGGDYFMLCTDGLLENITDSYLSGLLTADAATQTDITAAIQEKCIGKTRDNYSMYLLQLGSATPPPVQQKRKGYGLAVILLLLAIVAASLFFFNKKDTAAGAMPALTTEQPNSAAAATADSSFKKDTILQPGKNAVPDSEIINREEEQERKIAPAPLPETKPGADRAGNKKTDSLKMPRY